jgi:hypothetical protein
MAELEQSRKRNATHIIPTRSKSKIAHTLSWPVGAEEISRALAPATQLTEMVLHFREGFREEERRRAGIYRVIGVSYVANPLRLNSDPLEEIPLFNRWEIIVGPVPRALRHKVHELVLSSALPRIRDWLNERSKLELGGAEHLKFFYCEQGERFYSEEDERIEPLRIEE